MPIISLMIPGGDWRTFTVQIGGTVAQPKNLMIGDFAGALVDFLIIALVVFMVVKFVVKEEAAK